MGSRPLKVIPLAIAAVLLLSGILGIRFMVQNQGKGGAETRVDASVSAKDGKTGIAGSMKQGASADAPMGDPAAETAKSGQKDPQSQVAPVAVAQSACRTLKFRHKSARGHADAEECGEHRNAVAFDMRGIDQKSICVRVDGIPVAFEKEKDLLVFGPIAGPKAVVSVESCRGGAVRTSPCEVAKDQFMDAIAGEGKQERSPASAKWNSEDHEDDSDAVAEMDRELQDEASVAQGLPVFKGWVVEEL